MRPPRLLFQIVVLVTSVCLGPVSCGDGPDGPNEIAVTYDRDADWSPDGSRIVFERGQSNEPGAHLGGMYFYNLADSSLQVFLPGDRYLSPRFSPDGRWIVFSDYRNIYKIKTDGDSLEQLTFSSSNYDPDWSPDGKKIAYSKGVGADRGIHLLSLATKQDTLILPYSERPVWFSDELHLAVVSFNFMSGPEIALIDTLGHIIQRLTDNEAWKVNPAVSEEGDLICFNQKFPGRLGQLWTIRQDGSGLRQITWDGGDYPTFSPDGKWIVYTHTGSDDGSLWAMHPNGLSKRRLTNAWDK